MKKVFLLFTSLMIAFLSISCSSVPKKAAADKPLVIGIVSMYFPEKVSYQGDFDTSVKGAVKNNIEVSVEDVKTKKVYTTKTNSSFLIPHSSLSNVWGIFQTFIFISFPFLCYFRWVYQRSGPLGKLYHKK